MNAFKGIRVAVGLLILDAGINMIKKMKKKAFQIAVMCCSFVTMMMINIFAWNFSSILLMLISAFVSITVFMIQESRSGKVGDIK